MAATQALTRGAGIGPGPFSDSPQLLAISATTALLAPSSAPACGDRVLRRMTHSRLDTRAFRCPGPQPMGVGWCVGESTPIWPWRIRIATGGGHGVTTDCGVDPFVGWNIACPTGEWRRS